MLVGVLPLIRMLQLQHVAAEFVSSATKSAKSRENSIYLLLVFEAHALHISRTSATHSCSAFSLMRDEQATTLYVLENSLLKNTVRREKPCWWFYYYYSFVPPTTLPSAGLPRRINTNSFYHMCIFTYTFTCFYLDIVAYTHVWNICIIRFKSAFISKLYIRMKVCIYNNKI